MNQFIIIATDSLRAIGANACCSDTIVCKVISLQEFSYVNINWTLVIVVMIIALTIIISLLIHKAQKNDIIKAEQEKLERQHQWDVEDENRRKNYK